VLADQALADAERQLAQVDERLARAEDDYLDGKLTAEQWSRLETRLTGERPGAEAAVDQARQRRADLDRPLPEADMLRHAGDIRAARLRVASRTRRI
jgi:hypothetical protein